MTGERTSEGAAALTIRGSAWDRQPEESPRAWSAFTAYRDMHPHERAIAKVPAAIGRDAGYVRMCEEFSRRFRWVARVAEWDVYMDRVAQTESRTQRVDLVAIPAAEPDFPPDALVGSGEFVRGVGPQRRRTGAPADQRAAARWRRATAA